jgi:hypothetical protein
MIYGPPDIIAPGLRKFTKEGIWTHRQVQHDHTIVASLAKTGVGEPSHIRPKKEIDKLRGILLREEDPQSDCSLQAIDRPVWRRQSAGGWTAPIELDQSGEFRL